MGRDLFADLQKKPTIATDPHGENASPDEQEQEQTEDFMTKFFSLVKSTRDIIQKILDQVEVVEARHEDLLVAYNQTQTVAAKNALEETMGRITIYANKVRSALKQIGTENKEIKEQLKISEDSEMSADLRIREAQHTSLIRKFSDIMSRYNDIQAQNQRKYHDAIKRQCKIVDPDVTDEVVAAYVESGQSAEIFKGAKLQQAEEQLNDIKGRHEDIKRLERSLLELHEMFVDMSILVSEQGDMIERIETQVAKSSDYVETARKHVDRAHTLQKSVRKKRWCCTMLAIILIALVVVVVLSTVN